MTKTAPTNYVSVSVLRHRYDDALKNYNKFKSYVTALTLQKAKWALEQFFKDERSTFFVIDGDGIPDPNHVPPKEWRVIEGGKAATAF